MPQPTRSMLLHGINTFPSVKFWIWVNERLYDKIKAIYTYLGKLLDFKVWISFSEFQSQLKTLGSFCSKLQGFSISFFFPRNYVVNTFFFIIYWNTLIGQVKNLDYRLWHWDSALEDHDKIGWIAKVKLQCSDKPPVSELQVNVNIFYWSLYKECSTIFVLCI